MNTTSTRNHDTAIIEANMGCKKVHCYTCGWESSPTNRPQHLPRIQSAHVREMRKVEAPR